MRCPYCGEEMREGFLFGSKDGAFSFAEEVPGVFTNAKKAKGYVEISELEAGKRIKLKTNLCEKCRKMVVSY